MRNPTFIEIRNEFFEMLERGDPIDWDKEELADIEKLKGIESYDEFYKEFYDSGIGEAVGNMIYNHIFNKENHTDFWQ